jgi:hypothetical protein
MSQPVSKHYYLYATPEELQSLGVEEFYETDVSLLSAELTDEQVKSLIPRSDYCYKWLETPSPENNYRGKVKTCPFYDKMTNLPAQSNGYCHYLQAGDFTEDGTHLLFDMCKECGINVENE